MPVERSAPDRNASKFGFGAFPRVVRERLLGLLAPPTLNRADSPSTWPPDQHGLDYLHGKLVRLLTESGGHVEAATAIVHDLQRGALSAVIIDEVDGARFPIPPDRWRTERAKAQMMWSGWGIEGDHEFPTYQGFIYIVSEDAAESSAPTGPKPLELSDSEVLCKLLIHLVGKKTPAKIASQMAGRGRQVSERQVRRLITQATEILREKDL